MFSSQHTVIKAAIKRSHHFLKNVLSTIEEEHKKQRRERSSERKRHGHSHSHGHGHRHHSGDREHHRRTRTTWLETFANYMNEFANLAGDVNIETEKSDKPQESKTQADPKNKEQSSTQQPQCPIFSENVDIQNIQKLLSAYLNGGLHKPSTSATSTESESQEPTNIDVEMGQGDRAVPEEKVNTQSQASSSSEESKREPTPEIEKDKVDGWTVINKEKGMEFFGLENLLIEQVISIIIGGHSTQSSLIRNFCSAQIIIIILYAFKTCKYNVINLFFRFTRQ